MLFERQPDTANAEIEEAAFSAPERLDPKRMTEALEELNWDVDRWLLLLPVPRTPEARDLRGGVGRREAGVAERATRRGSSPTARRR